MLDVNIRFCFLSVFAGLILLATGQAASASDDKLGPIDPRRDYHTFANLDEVVMTHIYFNLDADFDNSKLGGYPDLTLQHKQPGVDRLVLDSNNLVIHKAQLEKDGSWVDTRFELSEPGDEFAGARRIAAH